MKIGFVSDSLGGLTFNQLLDHAARLGVSGVEINTGGRSTAPHFNLKAMKGDATARAAFLKAFADRGLEIVSAASKGADDERRPVLAERRAVCEE